MKPASFYFAANTYEYERRIFFELHMRERQKAAYVMANLKAPQLVLSFDATNPTDVKRTRYRYREEEQSKLDDSGRRYYVNLKYKVRSS